MSLYSQVMHFLFDEIDQLINIDITGRKNRELYSSAKKSTSLCLEGCECRI